MNTEIKGLSVLLLGAALLGFSAIFVKWAAPASPLVVGFYRMAFALPFVLRTQELRDRYVERFMKAGIEVRPLIAGNMQRQPFFKKYESRVLDLPGADFLHDNAFYCGNCPDYTESEIQVIIKCLTI